MANSYFDNKSKRTKKHKTIGMLQLIEQMRKSWYKNYTKQNHCNSKTALGSSILRERIGISNKYDNFSGCSKLVYLRAQWHVKIHFHIQEQKKFNTNPKYLMGKWVNIVIHSISHNAIRNQSLSGGFIFEKQSSREVYKNFKLRVGRGWTISILWKFSLNIVYIFKIAESLLPKIFKF